MIYTEKQLEISNSELSKLKEALVITLKQEKTWVKEIEIDGLESQISDIEAEISHYEIQKKD